MGGIQLLFFFFFNDTATTEIYTLSLHDALPIFASYAELTGIGSRISAAPGMPINTGTETASVRIDSTGTVTAAFGVASHGQGLETTLAQVVAENLGTRIEDVRIIQGDSSAAAHSTGSYAS